MRTQKNEFELNTQTQNLLKMGVRDFLYVLRFL